MGAFSILNSVNLSRTLLRLSSGKRINSGADDAAGLQIADSLRSNVRALDQAVRNANDGIGVAQIADGALNEIGNLLVRAVTLAEEAATATTDSSGRVSLDNEFKQIQAEIARIASQTNFNGTAVFSTSGNNFGGTVAIFVGDTSCASSIAVSIGQIRIAGETVTDVGGGVGLENINLTDATQAATSLTQIKNAVDAISEARASIGAGINRLQSAVAVLQSQSQNTTAAESTIRDANIAQEVASLTKYQILAQSGIASLAQANTSSQQVLNLLRM